MMERQQLHVARGLGGELDGVGLSMDDAVWDKRREPVTHVFSPTSGIVSLRAPVENGASTGIALTGNEGLIELSVLLEGLRARGRLRRAVVLSAGQAYRVRADCLLKGFQRGAALQHLLLRATQTLIGQIAQTAVCNRHHGVLERLSSWLLHSLDCLKMRYA